MQQSNSASEELHKRRTQPDDSEVDPVVAQLGEDCSKLYAKLEVRVNLDLQFKKRIGRVKHSENIIISGGGRFTSGDRR
jgi:hypothetical protein